MSDVGMAGGDSAGGSGADPREEGAALLRQGRFAEAASALRQATEQVPEDEAAWRLLGGALASLGDQFGAVSAFQRAAAINPESAKNQYNLAVALQGVGQVEEARDHLQQALRIDGAYEQAKARLAELGAAAAPVVTAPPAPHAGPPAVVPPTGPVLAPDAPPPPPPIAYPPPSGYAPPPGVQIGGAYGPPAPMLGQTGYGMAAPPVNGTLPLVLGIVGLILNITGPIAWVLANNALNTLDRYPNADQSQRGMVTTARVLGIIGTVFLGLGILFNVAVIVLAIAAAGKGGS